MSLIVIDPLRCAGWDERLPAGSGMPFHTMAWLRVLHASYGYTPFCLARGSETDWEPVLPLLEVASALTGRRGVSLPFTDECSPIDDTDIEEILAALRPVGQRRGWKYIELRSSPPDCPWPCSAEYVGHRLRLDVTEEELLAGCSSNNRRGIRRAEQAGVSVRSASRDADVHAFYRLQQKTRRRHGLPPQPYRFFDNVRRHCIDAGRALLLLAEWQGAVVAGAMFLLGPSCAVFKFGASENRHWEVRPNHLLMWRGLLACRASGSKVLTFGRSDCRQEGLRRFKGGWGGQEYRIAYLRFAPANGSLPQARAASSTWMNHLFGALPAPAARAVGTLAYRHMG